MIRLLFVIALSMVGVGFVSGTLTKVSDNLVGLSERPIFDFVDKQIVSAYSQSSSTEDPMVAVLSISDAPSINKPVTLTLTFTLKDNFEGPISGSAGFQLPTGFELVDGDLNWQGSIKPGEKQTIKATVVSKTETPSDLDYSSIKGSAKSNSEKANFGASTSIDVKVTKEKAAFIDKNKPSNASGAGHAVPANQ